MSDFNLEHATHDELELMKDQLDGMMKLIEKHAQTTSLVEQAEREAQDILAHAQREAEERVIRAKHEAKARIRAMEARVRELDALDAEDMVTVQFTTTRLNHHRMKAYAVGRGISLQDTFELALDLLIAEDNDK